MSNGRGRVSKDIVEMVSCRIGHSCSTEVGVCRHALSDCLDGLRIRDRGVLCVDTIRLTTGYAGGLYQVSWCLC